MEPIRTREELEALYDRHVNMVYQICLMLLKNVPDAEDATQTVFRKVMEYQKPFRDPEHEKGSSSPPGTSVKTSCGIGGTPAGRAPRPWRS